MFYPATYELTIFQVLNDTNDPHDRMPTTPTCTPEKCSASRRICPRTGFRSELRDVIVMSVTSRDQR